MKYATLFVVSVFILYSAQAHADQYSIETQSLGEWGGPMNGLGPAPTSLQVYGGICIVNAPSGLDFVACSQTNPTTDLSMSVNLSLGAPSSLGPGGYGSGTTANYTSIGGTVTVSFSGTPSLASPDPIPDGPIVTANIIGGSGWVAYGSNIPEGDSLYFQGNITAQDIDSAFFADMNLSTEPDPWTGSFNTYYSGVMDGGSGSLYLGVPAPDPPAPESGTFILLSLGVAAMAAAYGFRGRARRRALHT